MKRSELINRIVYEALSYSGLEDGLCTREEIAEDVLRVIEAAGMKPPKRLNPNHNGWQSDYSNIPAYLETWDPE